MSLFGKKKPAVLPIPEGYSAEDIRVESSTCTGETTIGFYSPADNKLHAAELVKTQEDIDRFYARYGVKK